MLQSCLAGWNPACDSRWLRHQRDHAAFRDVQAHGLTLARPLSRRGRGCQSARKPDPRGQGMVGEAPALQAALHAYQRVMAEPGRSFLCPNHDKAHPQGQLHQRRRSGSRHLRLTRAAQRQAKAVPLDQDGRRHPHPRTTRAGQTR